MSLVCIQPQRTPAPPPPRIYRCDRVIIPVHQGNHWTAMMVDLAQQRLVFFDSFLGQNRRAVANVKQWVMDEAKVRLGIGGGGEVFFACLFGGGVLPVG